MAWPADPPKHNRLHLFVRYVTADGRRLEANAPIDVALAGERQAGWTPAPPSARAADGGKYSDRGRGGELSGRRHDGPDLPPAAESWRPNETPPARGGEPPPEVATRTDPLRSERPAWSPDRR